MTNPVPNNRGNMRPANILDLLRVEHERSSLLVQLDSGRNGVEAVAHHSRRVFNREIYWHWDIDFSNDLLEFVLQILPNERLGLS